jgi:hypothetical protein
MDEDTPEITPTVVADMFQQLLEENAQLKRDLKFANRIMLQAVLSTPNHFIPVNVAYAPEAMRQELRLEYNSRGVTYLGSVLSDWPVKVKT